MYLVIFCRVEELMLSLDESSETLHKNLKEKEKENKNLERRYDNMFVVLFKDRWREIVTSLSEICSERTREYQDL